MAKRSKLHSDPWDAIVPATDAGTTSTDAPDDTEGSAPSTSDENSPDKQAAGPEQRPEASEQPRTASDSVTSSQPADDRSDSTASSDLSLLEDLVEPPRPRGAGNTPLKINATFYLEHDLVEKVRDVAYWERYSNNEFVAFCLKLGIAYMEKQRNESYRTRPKDD